MENNLKFKRFFTNLFILILLGAISSLTFAQDSSKTIKIVVPFVPGGSTDIIGRIISERLSVSLKQPVIVENRPGAGGTVGSQLVSKSPPDGSTLLLTSVTTAAIAYTLYPNLQYDLKKDFEPVAVLGSIPLILLVSNKLPIKNLEELIAYAKNNPGQLTFGSAGNGTSPHLAGELFKRMANIDIIHVPYKGNSPALNDLMGGHLNIMFDFLPSSIQLVKSNKVNAIAITSAKRSSLLPNIPTMSESGLSDFNVLSYFGIFAPAKISKATLMNLNSTLNQITTAPQNKEKFYEAGIDPAAESVQWFNDYLSAEIDRWAKVIKAGGVKAE
jgi:tripartite-type tricarboxylate transporter receptor subunit TctC